MVKRQPINPLHYKTILLNVTLRYFDPYSAKRLLKMGDSFISFNASFTFQNTPNTIVQETVMCWKWDEEPLSWGILDKQDQGELLLIPVRMSISYDRHVSVRPLNFFEIIFTIYFDDAIDEYKRSLSTGCYGDAHHHHG